MAKKLKNINIENARIGFRNFSGKESQFNPAGRRNFCVFLDNDIAKVLAADGWNVKYLEPRDENEEPQAYLQVSVNYDIYPPKILMITYDGSTILDEDTVSVLDWADIETVDLIIRPYAWTLHAGTRNEKSGIKAYIKNMYVKIVEEEFERKWANPPIDIDE